MMNSSNGSSSNADPPVYSSVCREKKEKRNFRVFRENFLIFSHFVRFPEKMRKILRKKNCENFAIKKCKKFAKKNTEKMQKNTKISQKNTEFLIGSLIVMGR